MLRNLHRAGTFALTVVASIAGCGGDSDSPREDSLPSCTDAIDNDADGHVDCDDQDCEIFAACLGDADADADADGDTDGDSDADGDSDTDADADADTDGDSDADADADTDADGDADVDCVDGWSDEIVDDVTTPTDAAIGLDSNGYVHIAYTEIGTYALWHASNESGEWVTELVDDLGDTGLGPVLVIEQDDTIHVVYYRSYAVLSASRLPAEEWVLAEHEAGSVVVAAIDDDVTHVSYGLTQDGEFTGLRHATFDDGVWEWEDVGTARGAPRGVAVDADGAVHVGFSRFDQKIRSTAWYATNATGEWVAEPVENDEYVDGLAFAPDPDGAPHMALSIAGELWLADRADGSWPRELVDTDGHAAEPTVTLGYDPAGSAHLLLEDAPGLLHVTSASGEWVVDRVNDDIGRQPDFKIDADGGLHVAFVTSGDGALRYAHQCP